MLGGGEPVTTSLAKWLVVAKWLLGAIGLALLVVGAVKVIATSSDAGVIILVIAGALLLVSPFILDRVEGISVSTTSIKFWLTREISELGAPKTAQIVERTIAGAAESYAFIHEELAGPEHRNARIQLQDLLVERCAAVARREKFQPSEVRMLFKNGSPMIRVLVLGLMRGDPSLADGATITAAIADSRSRNEQYQGLRLAEQCWHRLSKSDQDAIRAAINGSDIPLESSRRLLADAVLSLAVS